MAGTKEQPQQRKVKVRIAQFLDALTRGGYNQKMTTYVGPSVQEPGLPTQRPLKHWGCLKEPMELVSHTCC